MSRMEEKDQKKKYQYDRAWIRFKNPSELESIKKAAEADGRSMAAWLRMAALDKLKRSKQA